MRTAPLAWTVVELQARIDIDAPSHSDRPACVHKTRCPADHGRWKGIFLIPIGPELSEKRRIVIARLLAIVADDEEHPCPAFRRPVIKLSHFRPVDVHAEARIATARINGRIIPGVFRNTPARIPDVYRKSQELQVVKHHPARLLRPIQILCILLEYAEMQDIC